MVKGLKTGTNLFTECSSPIRCKCPFWMELAIHTHTHTHKKIFPLSKGPINAPLSQELVGEALSTKENSTHCQYADF